MTIEEMDDVIQDYCERLHKEGDCIGCVIEKQCDSVMGCFGDFEDVCKEAYEILVNHLRCEPEALDNPYWERINAIAEKQRVKGINKYGAGLESNPAAILERINHLQEELIDGLMYCEWIKDHLNG